MKRKERKKKVLRDRNWKVKSLEKCSRLMKAKNCWHLQTRFLFFFFNVKISQLLFRNQIWKKHNYEKSEIIILLILCKQTNEQINKKYFKKLLLVKKLQDTKFTQKKEKTLIGIFFKLGSRTLNWVKFKYLFSVSIPIADRVF